MSNSQNTSVTPATIFRSDYRVPDWLVPTIHLDFDLSAPCTRVRATISVLRSGVHDRPLRLDGDGLTPISVRLDGQETRDWSLEGDTLIIPLTGTVAIIETTVEINPEANTALMGLYASKAMLCSQCEAEGLRQRDRSGAQRKCLSANADSAHSWISG